MTDLATLSDDDLSALRVAVLTEQERRYTLATAAEQAADLATRYSQAVGRQPGDEWTAPTGAHDAYPHGATVTHDGRTWESLTAANVWEPGISGWREQGENDGQPPAWVQPTGGHDAYATGDRITWTDGHI